ncbi:MAG: NnrU family protein [Alphaproteobacteria bacterium]
MTGSLPALVAAAVFFVASHFVLSSPIVRDGIVGRLGEKPFRALHGVVDLAAPAWLILAYTSAPYVALWPPVMAARYVPLVVMPVVTVLLVCGLTTKNPTAMYWEKPGDGDPVPGILKITRHPVMWAVVLWAFAHMAPNGDMGSVIFIAAFATMAAVGMGAIDRRRQRLMGDAWGAIAATTSNLPFAALLGGRTKLDFKGIGVWRVAGGLALYGALLLAHGPVIGLVVLPF